MKKPTILFFITVVSVGCTFSAVTSQTSELPQESTPGLKEPTLENSPKAIKQLCKKGRVAAWKYDKQDEFIYSFKTSQGVGGGYAKHDYRNAEGKHIGYGHSSDQQTELADGRKVFCVFNRRECPKFVKEVCPFPENRS